MSNSVVVGGGLRTRVQSLRGPRGYVPQTRPLTRSAVGLAPRKTVQGCKVDVPVVSSRSILHYVGVAGISLVFLASVLVVVLTFFGVSNAPLLG